MLIQFQIEYKTLYGQQMMLTGSLPQLGGGIRDEAVTMHYAEGNGGLWTFLVRMDDPVTFGYSYFLKDENVGIEKEDWGNDRNFVPPDEQSEIVILEDHWLQMSDPDMAFLTSAFTEAIFRPRPVTGKQKSRKQKPDEGITVCFMPLISRINPGHRVVVTGNATRLGKWDPSAGIVLQNDDFPRWEAKIILQPSDFPLEYKYLVQNENGETLFWEKCSNRVNTLPEDIIPDRIEIRDERFDFPGSPWKGTGMAIPVFSIRRENGWGIGEFSDLAGLTDWAEKAGLQLIQILPVNDTIARHTWQDSYPYAAISVFALHPAYINLTEIGKLDDPALQREFEQLGKQLNGLEKIDYEGVMALKSGYFKLIFDQQRDTFLTDPEFSDFLMKNRFWLEPYAAFSYLRDKFRTADFSGWNEYTLFTSEKIRELTDPGNQNYDDIAIHYFIQFHAHRQLSRAADYARSKGIALKGDLPIGIFRNSVDAWVNPELFHMDCQTGAPPDDFSATGQNWRFPTYNWEKMAEDHYGWWQRRLRHLSEYFDAFRIDHILGFFRIWEIPGEQVQGIMGWFNPSIPYTRSEILAKGIWFDENRHCRPYIRDHMLSAFFGEETDYVRSTFIREYAPGCFELNDDLNTQQKIEAYTADMITAHPEDKERWQKLRDGLFGLAAEVIFLEKTGKDEKVYFPRSSFHSTFSYRELDYNSQKLLDDLYIEYFYRRNETLWRNKALVRLPAIKSATNMLLCGEDLGMVPACVPGVMLELGLLSLEVQRMPKDTKTEFGHTEQYPYLSVATPSSHDTSTIRGWWVEDPGKTQRFYNQVLGRTGDAPRECTAEMVREVISRHLSSNSMWAVFPIQDLLGIDEVLRFPDPDEERINEPGNPEHYWQYRLHLPVEKLTAETSFTAEIRKMIVDSGRNRIY